MLRDFYPFYETEKDAEDFVFKVLDTYGVEYKKQHWTKDGKHRLDLVIIVEGEFYPIEIKRSFRSKSEQAAAFGQASDYARKIGRPVFLGPVPYDSKLNDEHNRLACSYAQHNVGFMCIGSEGVRLFLSEFPVLTVDQYRTKTNPMRQVRRDGSKKYSPIVGG